MTQPQKQSGWLAYLKEQGVPIAISTAVVVSVGLVYYNFRRSKKSQYQKQLQKAQAAYVDEIKHLRRTPSGITEAQRNIKQLRDKFSEKLFKAAGLWHPLARLVVT